MNKKNIKKNKQQHDLNLNSQLSLAYIVALIVLVSKLPAAIPTN